MWAIWCAGIALLAALAWRLPAQSPPEVDWTRGTLRLYRSVPLARWDAGWYYLVAVNGYHYDPKVLANTIGFYPLYPLLLRAAAAALPSVSIFVVGILLSMLFLLGALLLVARLSELWDGPETRLPAIAAILFFPTSFFYASVYTESLFLLTTAAAIASARANRWILAGFAGAAAGLTRLNGCLILVPLAYLAWEGSARRWRFPGRTWTGLGLALAGVLAFPAYLGVRFGDPLLYVHEKSNAFWSPRPGAPWKTAWRIGKEAWRRLADPAAEGRLLFLSGVACFLVFLALSVLLLRRGLVAEGLYAVATLLFLLCGGTFDGIQRYVLALFPCFFPIAGVLRRSPVLAFAYAFLGIGTGVVLLHRFVHSIFVA